MSNVAKKKCIAIDEHVVEIVSDAGEGAQRAGQTFGTLSAKMGNSIWTVEIIPAEIEPPRRTMAGASGNRIRVGAFPITNAGDAADLVVAFNEQALLGRVQGANLKPGCVVLLEKMWATHRDASIVAAYKAALEQLNDYRVIEVPMEESCLKIVKSARTGKNMFILGMLCSIYRRDMETARQLIISAFKKKEQEVIDDNIVLLEAGFAWAEENLDFQFEIKPIADSGPQIVMNGNTAIGLGVIASGMEVCAMYPITPATSASHYLSEVFQAAGGIVHQAEDEIAACAFAIGASYAGKCAVTITSGPGLALKTELIGFASMTEIPLVLVNVQRGGPSTGLPTKVEQGDLLMALYNTHGDAPKIVMASATIEDCFYQVIEARKIAEEYRMPVIVLSDANLATGQQTLRRPEFDDAWLAPDFPQDDLPEGFRPYAWDPVTGLSARAIPGQRNGLHTLTGLAHDQNSKVAYDPGVNQEGCRHRSLKLAAFQKTLKTPKVMGADEGDVLVVGWGSTQGAIEEAVGRVQKSGLNVSSLHLTYLQPMASGIGEILAKYKKVICVEINFSDSLDEQIIDNDNRRLSNLAILLRSRYLVDVDSWGNVHGQPLQPGSIEAMIREQVAKLS